MADDLNIKLGGDSIKAIIDAQVRGAVAAALGKNSDALIRALVQEAFLEKSDRYEKETKFEKIVKSAIREEGTEAFKEWLKEIRPQIRAEFQKQLKAAGPKKIFDAFIESITASVPTMRLNIEFFPKGEDRF